MNIRRLTPHVGAEITGVDVTRLTDADFDRIVATIDEAGMVAIRDQKIDDDQLVAFSERIGPLAIHPLQKYSLPGRPEIMVNSNIIDDGKPRGMADGGQNWHTDGAYLERPHRMTILHALIVPERDGQPVGDTLFSSTGAAWDALDPALQRRLAGMRAVHSHGVYRYRRGGRGKLKEILVDEAQAAVVFKGVEHPVARTHPRTGRKCLYVNEGTTLRFADLDEAASAPLLDELFQHAIRPEFVYRHHWRVGDLVMWDNCSTQHCAVGDYDPLPRELHRTVILGDRPV